MNDSGAPEAVQVAILPGRRPHARHGRFISWQANFTLGHWEMCFVALCVLAGALLGIAPFLLEYEALTKLSEAGALTTVAAQLQNLEAIAAQITGATGRWQDAQDAAEKTSRAAREIAERMTAEVQAFTEFMQRANESERATLRLEVEKLRRAEADWLQVLVRVLDHVYALHARARSAPASLILSSNSAPSRTPAAMPPAASVSLPSPPLNPSPSMPSGTNPSRMASTRPPTPSSPRPSRLATPSRADWSGPRWCASAGTPSRQPRPSPTAGRNNRATCLWTRRRPAPRSRT